MKNCNKKFEDRTLKEEFLCNIKQMSKWFLWVFVFFMLLLQTSLNLNMMSDIEQLKAKINGQNEFKLKKIEIKKMSPELSKQIQKRDK